MFLYKDFLKQEHIFRIENNVVYYIDYFIFNDKDSLIKSGQTGMYRDKNKWEVTHHYPTFILPNSNKKTYKVFLKTWSDETTALTITIKPEKTSIVETYHSQFLYGMYYGAILIMILYNIFIYFTTKIIHIYFMSYIFSRFVCYNSIWKESFIFIFLHTTHA